MNVTVAPIPPEAVVTTVESPSFMMRFPGVVHPELIPIHILRAMERTWGQRFFDPRPVRVAVMEDVLVVEEGLVFDAAGALIQESITQHSPEEIARGHHAAAAARAAGLEAQPGLTVLCKKRGVGNYGHWMAEMLPRAHLAQTALADPAHRYLAPAVDGPLAAIITQSLAALGVDAAHTIIAGPEAVRLERVILVDGLAQHGGYLSPLVMACFDRVAAGVPGTGATRLLVTRDGAPGRQFVDEPDLRRRAVGFGYQVVEPGGMTLAEQVAAFRDATHIVGAMGAGMTNTAFAPPGARVTIVAPAIMPDTFFWFLAGLRGHDYHEVRCPLAGESQGNAEWDAFLALPLQERDRLFR